jgi:hypothetical protein
MKMMIGLSKQRDDPELLNNFSPLFVYFIGLGDEDDDWFE